MRTSLVVALMTAAVTSESLPAQAPPVVVPPNARSIPRTKAQLDIVPLDFSHKLKYYSAEMLSPGALLVPALPAGIIMADPPSHYPREWRQGAQAFGRNFGDSLATQAAANTGKFLAGALLREDPRYFPARSRNVAVRIGHAVLFTLVDRSDTGHRRLALSTLAGAASAGFAGRTYLPRPYDDNAHAERRSLGALGGYVPTLLAGYATDHLAKEFSPELMWLARKLRLPGAKR